MLATDVPTVLEPLQDSGGLVTMSSHRIYVGYEYWGRTLRPWLGSHVSATFFVVGDRIDEVGGVLTGLGDHGLELDSQLLCRWDDLVAVEKVSSGRPRTHADEVFMHRRASTSQVRSQSATRRRWKRAEREVAAYLGGVRVPVNGRGYAPDVDHPLLSLEIKQTNRSPQRIERAVRQAERASEWCREKQGAEKVPVAVIHQTGRPMGKSLVVMRLEDFEAWLRFGPGSRGVLAQQAAE